MPKLTVLPHKELCPQGMTFDVSEGQTLCDALLSNGIYIEHACEKCGACSTCHIVVKKGFESLSEIEEKEEDRLDLAWGLTPTSRLSCQAKMGKEDVTIEIPKYSLNHAKERGHL